MLFAHGLALGRLSRASGTSCDPATLELANLNAVPHSASAKMLDPQPKTLSILSSLNLEAQILSQYPTLSTDRPVRSSVLFFCCLSLSLFLAPALVEIIVEDPLEMQQTECFPAGRPSRICRVWPLIVVVVLLPCGSWE